MNTKYKKYIKRLKNYINNNCEVNIITRLSYDTSSYISYLPKDIINILKLYLLDILVIRYFNDDIYDSIIYIILMNDCIIKYKQIDVFNNSFNDDFRDNKSNIYIKPIFKNMSLYTDYINNKPILETELLINDRYIYDRDIVISRHCEFRIYIVKRYSYLYCLLMKIFYYYITYTISGKFLIISPVKDVEHLKIIFEIFLFLFEILYGVSILYIFNLINYSIYYILIVLLFNICVIFLYKHIKKNDYK